MTVFKICGRGEERVNKTRRVLGRACFLSGLDVVDLILKSHDPNGYNIAYVKADKKIASKAIEDADYLLLLDEKFSQKAMEGIKEHAVIFANSREKIAPKNVKAKCYITSGISDTEIALLGGLTKDFPKVSIKSMKAAIEEELGNDKSVQLAFDEGYKNVR